MHKLTKQLTGSLLVFSLLSSAAACAQEIQQLSLKQCIDYALIHQTAVKSARLDEAITDAQNREITGSALPQISGSGSFTDNLVIQKQLIDVSIFDPTGRTPKGTLAPFEFGLQYNLLGFVTISQTLFDGAVLVALQAKKTVEELARKNVQETQRDTRVNVSKAYYNVLVTREELNQLSDNIHTLSESLHETQEMYNNGVAEQLDIDRINVQLTNLETQQISLRNSLELGYELLKFQMGMPMGTSLALTDTLTFDDVRADLADTTGFSYGQRIEYSILQSEKMENLYNLKRYKMAYLPTLNANGVIGANRATEQFDYFNPHQFWYGYGYVGLSLNVPIFSSGERKSRVEEAMLNVDKMEVAMDELKQSIDLEQQQAGSNLRNDLQAIASQQKNMALAKEVYTTTQKKFEQGVGSNLEVITAENDLETARTNYFNALYDAMIAKIDYQKAYGKIQ
ncbi:MAG TPA: TolC family protein [Chitinophagaceae bacterium]|nr:TolC family protein [Chitinophagaceae bacterium]